MTHTKEPWSVAEESFDNDGIEESVIRGLAGQAAIAVTLDFGDNNPLMREANARRIVACVNACKGIPNAQLEMDSAAFIATFKMHNTLIKQRDELLAALKDIAEDYADRFDMESPSTNPGIKLVVKQAISAIASVKVQP